MYSTRFGSVFSALLGAVAIHAQDFGAKFTQNSETGSYSFWVLQPATYTLTVTAQAIEA